MDGQNMGEQKNPDKKTSPNVFTFREILAGAFTREVKDFPDIAKLCNGGEVEGVELITYYILGLSGDSAKRTTHTAVAVEQVQGNEGGRPIVSSYANISKYFDELLPQVFGKNITFKNWADQIIIGCALNYTRPTDSNNERRNQFITSLISIAAEGPAHPHYNLVTETEQALSDAMNKILLEAGLDNPSIKVRLGFESFQATAKPDNKSNKRKRK